MKFSKTLALLVFVSTTAFAALPVLAPIGNQSVDEGATLNVPLSATDDDGGDTLTFSETGLPSFCSLTDNNDRTGDVDCAPGFDEAGTYPVTITVSDGTDDDSETFDIVVGDVNRAPVLATIGNQSVDEGATLNVPLSASDPDSGDTLTFGASGLPSFCSRQPVGERGCHPQRAAVGE
jgi:hypothetical protein